jgi:hypothetical protein
MTPLSVVSALNHPHICTLCDDGHEVLDGRTAHYLVFELIEGESRRSTRARRSRCFRRALRPSPRGVYRPTPDGQRFLIVSPLGRDAIQPATVVLNWPNALR